MAAIALVGSSAYAQFSQQGPKLVGSGTIGGARQGFAVALSADGNTTMVAGPNDNHVGAVWVFARSGGMWMQQGNKLVGSGAGQGGAQGNSVALSADGDIAIVGSEADDLGIGAVWAFTRSSGVWTQEGNKLVGVASLAFAWSVALSGDGNTALVGGPGFNGNTGETFVFTRSGGLFTLQTWLVGAGGVGWPSQGISVALSGNGNTAIIGGDSDNSGMGAAWVFTRSGGVWTQEGPKLVGSGAIGNAHQGHSAALSADGNTAIIGGYQDNGFAGAVWVFTRSGGVWTQQGAKLVGSGAVGTAQQGWSAALSGDGNTAIIGGCSDNSGMGAAWVFTRSGGVWTQQGAKLVGSGAVGNADQGWSVALSQDGRTAMIGGDQDDGTVGAAWVFAAAPAVSAVPMASLAGLGALVLFVVASGAARLLRRV